MAKIICIKTKEVLGHLPRSETLTPRAVRLWRLKKSRAGLPCKLFIIASDEIEAQAIKGKIFMELDRKQEHKLILISTPPEKVG